MDGEREIEFNAHDLPTVTLDAGGPLSIDVNAALAYAARERLLAIGREHPQHPLNLEPCTLKPEPQDTLENKNVDTADR